MCDEANYCVGHDEAAEIIAAEWRRVFPTVRREQSLPNGRVADVMGCVVAGDIYVAEVKHALKSSLIEEALEKYGRFCNYLYFAVAGVSDATVQRYVPITDFPKPWHRVGIIGVYPGSIDVIRSPSYRQVGRLDAADVRALVRASAGR